jgi:hypothetical protein
MVRAILNGHKTQTRRVAKLTVAGHVKKPGGHRRWHPDDPEAIQASPYGALGDRLWVRETWAIRDCGSRVSLAPEAWPNGFPRERVEYLADGRKDWEWNKRPSIHMPRWACRLTLKVTAVRVERVQAISEDDALAEGIREIGGQFPGCFWVPGGEYDADLTGTSARGCFERRWNRLNARRGYGWDGNPYVWVLTFALFLEAGQ